MNKAIYWARIGIATLAASASGFLVHVLYGRSAANDYVQTAAQAGRLSNMLQEPYPSWVAAIASSTAILPTIALVIIWFLIRERLPGNNRLIKGAWFALLVLATRDAFLRAPIMQVVIGMPLDVTLVQSLEGWLTFPIMAMLIAVIAPYEASAVRETPAEAKS